MGTISYRQKTAASEIQFFRNIDVSAADFDGTNKAGMNVAYLSPDGYNMFGEGFYFMPETAGDVKALSYVDWIQNDKVVNDAYAQILPSCAAGIMHPIRVVKVYTANTVTATFLAGV